MSDYLTITNPSKAVPLNTLPVLDYGRFYECVLDLMEEDESHCLNYFAFPFEGDLLFLCFIANDAEHSVAILAHKVRGEGVRGEKVRLISLASKCIAMHGFEREIHENFGVEFEGHPWLKPVRFPTASPGEAVHLKDYPFYSIESEELHEVGVGPVHAGIIEPGHFRFLCNGENVLHLEIQLGYQHRGIEALMSETGSQLKSCVLAENIAGDSSVAHSMAHVSLLESLSNIETPLELKVERRIALELERIAIHLGDSAALCTDIAYQLGQVVNESLRTIVINTTQLWCGNRFGKGLIRPGGTNYPLNRELAETILNNLDKVMDRYLGMTDKMFSMPSVLARFDGIGTVSREQLKSIGAVGMAARMGGLNRDIRVSHPDVVYKELNPAVVLMDSGDVLARAVLRRKEIEQSKDLIRNLLTKLDFNTKQPDKPDFTRQFTTSSLAFSLVEGWRGEICHVAVTDEVGKIIHYKVKDPSFHNWMALALAVRGQEISDFPVCNKSFNLSYCGHDL